MLRLSPLIFILVLASCQPGQQEAEKVNIEIGSPEKLYGRLFLDVQLRTDLFPDSKTFVDCTPLKSPSEISALYDELENKESKASLLSFLEENFIIPGYKEQALESNASEVSEHVQNLWSVLKRAADDRTSGTLIPLPNDYVVPGGRFREVYYWDSYFTMLGLKVDGEQDLIDNIVANFSFLIDSIGFIPNGNRAYYGSRSQPPFYALMVALSVEGNKEKSIADYHQYLVKEYNFWMDGATQLNDSKPTHRRAVRLDEGEILNRYWDDSATPRPESYREDIETVEEALEKDAERSQEASYRHLRAAAESGWDFSTRWFEIEEEGTFELSSIHTTDIIPVDLNALLYYLETLIARSHQYTGLIPDSEAFMEKAKKRKDLLIKYCWNEELGFFMDYDVKKKAHTPVRSLAGVYPLFFEMASEDQAKKVASVIERDFLKPGGVITTLNQSGQQWDAPNGWAPLQWMTVKGLQNYNQGALATEITSRWLRVNEKVFNNTGKMMEKYNVMDTTLLAGGGEYPNQDGFGWTNGVYQKLKASY